MTALAPDFCRHPDLDGTDLYGHTDGCTGAHAWLVHQATRDGLVFDLKRVLLCEPITAPAAREIRCVRKDGTAVVGRLTYWIEPDGQEPLIGATP